MDNRRKVQIDSPDFFTLIINNKLGDLGSYVEKMRSATFFTQKRHCIDFVNCRDIPFHIVAVLGKIVCVPNYFLRKCHRLSTPHILYILYILIKGCYVEEEEKYINIYTNRLWHFDWKKFIFQTFLPKIVAVSSYFSLIRYIIGYVEYIKKYTYITCYRLCRM